MKNIAYPIITCIILVGSQAFTARCFAGNSLDVNLKGGANLNVNNANNNKLTTPLKNFTPIAVPQGQVDLLPIATPPVTSTVTNVFGGWKNVDIVDPGYSNAAEAKAIHKREGTYVGTLPEGVADDQPVQAEDISNFLDGYHSYLKDVGVESGHSPANYAQPKINKDSKVKTTTELPSGKSNAVELMASEQKLLIDTPTSNGAQKNH